MAKSLSELSDSELLTVSEQTIAAATANPSAYDTTLPAITVLDGLRTTFDGDVTSHVAAQAASKSARSTKDASRSEFETALRDLRNRAKAIKASDADLAALGLPGGSQKIPSNATKPTARVDTSQRLQHTIHWMEETTPDNKKKPRGQIGAEIWLKLDGAPPTDEKECVFLTIDASTPYLHVYDGEDAGKMAHYLLRWRGKDGSVGPWSETVSATITG